MTRNPTDSDCRMDSTEKLFLEALRCGVAGLPVPWTEKPEEAAQIALVRLARAQALQPVIAHAISGCPAMGDSRAFRALKREARAVTIRQATRTAEFLLLLRELNARGLRPAVFKGAVCRSLYPEPEQRPSSDEDILIAFTAYHLWRWYADNRFCGRCGRPLSFKHNERALICPKCGNVVYPRINPAVIVGVTNGDKLLITRYKIGFAHNALVAGFTEIGETLEQTVAREVMEETGIRVKNIRYYKSQPWGMAQDVLTGFYCDVDGDTEIKMDDVELKFAEWIKREDIELQPNDLSLTNEMMKMFKEGKI